MSSIISICNLALSNIGKDNINSLSEASAEARACNQFYAHTLDTLLQSYPWRFAGKTQALAAVASPNRKWRYAYPRPSDCLKVRWLMPHYEDGDFRLSDKQEAQLPYDIDGGLILSDMSPAWLRYTARIDDPSRFGPLFSDALSWHLAVRLSMPLTRDPKVRADAYNLATELTSMAREADANETRENADISSALMGAR